MTESSSNYNCDRENSFTTFFDQNMDGRPPTVIQNPNYSKKNEGIIQALNVRVACLEEKCKDLTFELKQVKEGKFICLIPNKWKFIDSRYSCCEYKCVNVDMPDSFCRRGNGFIRIMSDTKIEYISVREDTKGNDKLGVITAENSFIKPKNNDLSQYFFNCIAFSLFYYEVKLQMKQENKLRIGIGLSTTAFLIILHPEKNLIQFNSQKKRRVIDILFSFKDGDTIGCGLVYAPPGTNKLPYVFFTQNGKQIGKAILLEEDYDYLQPVIELRRCSIETNFGEYPFVYQISKHYVAEEFYKEEEFSDKE